VRAARTTSVPAAASRPPHGDLSVRLAEQAPAALRLLLRPFDVDKSRPDTRRRPPRPRADRAPRLDLRRLRDGLVTVLLRLAFLLHAEARDLLPRATHDLHRRLREAAAHADLDARHEAWPDLLALFRRVHHTHGGALFDPDRHRLLADARVPDGAVLHILNYLRTLDDAPVSYDSLDIEHLGHLYESLTPIQLSVTADGLDLQINRHRTSDARRRSGSHYTPRTLTAPVVRTTLAPVLAALGPDPAPARILQLVICDPAAGCGAFLLETCRQLADHLRLAWQRHGPPDALPDRARELVALRCLRGVDRDPVAVDLARLSLWLLARSTSPFTVFDPVVKHGDSLIGLTRAQRRTLAPATVDGLQRLAAALRIDGAPVPAFAWESAFPDVFTRDNPGFDCCLGNPPFLGGTRISTTLSAQYLKYLTTAFPGAGNRTDLVAYFFRRSYDLLRDGGALGLIGTNTLAQGDTRGAGLAHLRERGATIYAATRRLKWPGSAAVVASVVHILKNARPPGPALLDGAPVPTISAFLLPGQTDRDPARLAANRDLVFTGMKPYADGLIFSDDSPKTTPLAEMRRLVEADPRNAARIFPYIGGKEINTHPRQEHHRHIIHFAAMSETEAARWPALLKIARDRVRPERLRKSAEVAAHPWWQFWRPRPELSEKLRHVDRVLVNSQVSTHHAFAFQPANRIFSHALNVFILPGHAAFALLQSRVHEIWARTFGSSMKDDLRYTASDCFETFPLPPRWQTDPALEAAGRRYDAHRAASMVSRDEGLTATYHRFHDPETTAPDLLIMRDLHAELDRAALSAYGWTDLAARLVCEFRLDYDDNSSTTEHRPRRRPWRYRWPQDLHDEVLARLLDLNRRAC